MGGQKEKYRRKKAYTANGGKIDEKRQKNEKKT
jgi:hypothetical protein